tara:strand:+ start:2397 stop:2708 length:312 start_codon:yes stop_codon:yes gene_type:complete
MTAAKWQSTADLVATAAVTVVVLYAIRKVFVDKNGFLVGENKKGKKQKIAAPVKPSGWRLIDPKDNKAKGKVYKTKNEARKAYNKKYANKKVKEEDNNPFSLR